MNFPLSTLATPLILQAIPVSGANRDFLCFQGGIHRSVSSFQFRAYYNEIDPYCAAWLRNLIAAGHIADGDVDERSIVDVRPDDLRPYRQCHFFAGLGGWSYALRLAEWPDDRPVWTGSCPCQPISVAGQRRGHADERHLWPAFHRLIAECKPATIFGEQVASKDGREWLAAVRADLEANGYAIGAADLCAASVGAPHIRQRLWWVAHSDSGDWRQEPHQFSGERSARSIPAGELADAEAPRLQARLSPGRLSEAGAGVTADSRSPWSDLIWLPCTDGKARPTQPSICPLAHGVSGRMGKLRAAGNAIVPQVASEFIKCIFKLD